MELREWGPLMFAGYLVAACSADDVAETADMPIDLETPVLEVVPAEDIAALAEDAVDPAEARMAVDRWARAWHGQALIEPVPIFFGDATGDGHQDVLAIVYSEIGISAYKADAVLFRQRETSFAFHKALGTINGIRPRNVSLADREVRLTTSVLVDGDENCCPTGSQDWVLTLPED